MPLKEWQLKSAILDVSRCFTDFFLIPRLEWKGRYFVVISTEKMDTSLNEKDVLEEICKRPDAKQLFDFISDLKISDIRPSNVGRDHFNLLRCFDFETMASLTEINQYGGKFSEMEDKLNMLNAKKAKEALLNIKKSAEFFNSQPLLTANPFKVQCYQKVVFKGDDDRIYRISSEVETIQRLLLIQYFEELGLSKVFLAEKAVPELSVPGFMVTTQTPVKVQDLSDSEAVARLEKQCPGKESLLRDTLDALNIIWFGGKNCGELPNGELRIFDCISNTAVTERTPGRWTLVNARGESLSVKEF